MLVNVPSMTVISQNNVAISETTIGVINDYNSILSTHYVELFGGRGTFENAWWPGDSVDITGGGVLGAASWGKVYPVGGANGRLAIVGITRDAYGSPIGYATVKIFRTSDDSLQSTIVSDSNGVYSVTTPYADGHYLVVYKAGPPDICGTTVNTLLPG